MKNRGVKIALILPLVLVAVLAGGWYAAASAITNAVGNWAEQQRQQGMTASWQTYDMTGFPVRLTGIMQGARFTGQNGELAWSWTPPPLALRFFPLSPNQVEVDAPGAHAIQLTAGANAADLQATAAVATSRVEVSPSGAIEVLFLALEDLAVSDGVSGLRARAGRVNLNAEVIAGAGQPIVVSRGQIIDLRLPPELDTPLGQNVPFASFDAALVGALPADPTAADVARWRDAGGTVDLRAMDLVWGPLRAVGTGSLTLDADLQPTGEISARIEGLDGAIKAFEEAGLIDTNAAALARIAIVALSRPSGTGGRAAVELPLRIDQRRLSLGPLQLFTLPSIRWAAP